MWYQENVGINLIRSIMTIENRDKKLSREEYEHGLKMIEKIIIGFF